MAAIPEHASVAMAEIAENMQEGLLVLAVGAGLQVMQGLMEADVAGLCGPKAATTRHAPRCVTAPSAARCPWVGVGWPVSRPRVRAVNGSGDLPIASPRPLLPQARPRCHGSSWR